MNVLRSLGELEQRLAVEKLTGVIRLAPADEKEFKAVWAEAGRLESEFPALSFFLVRDVLGDDHAEERTAELLRRHGHPEKFLLLPLYWIAWRGQIAAVYKQSGMIMRDLLSMFGGKDPIAAVAAWIEEKLDVERGTGKPKPRKPGPKREARPGADRPTAPRTRPPHVILGVAPDADEATARTAYRKLCARYHPDKFAQASKREQDEANRRMTEINAAWESFKKGRAAG